MKKQQRVMVSLLASLLIGACQGDKSEIKPSTGALVESVYSSIIIEPDSFYQVYAAARGIIDEIYVKEGDLISKGDPIARIVDDNSKLLSENAALEMNLAQQNYEGQSNLIKDLQNELAVAKLKLINDSINLERQKRLWNQQIGSRTELEQRQLVYETSLNNVNTLKRKLDRKQDELKVLLQKSKNNYTNSLNNYKDYNVLSRVNGQVYELLKEEGELLSEQEPIGVIGSSNRFLIKMQVDEVDIVRIKTGQLVYVTLDAYNSQVFEAEVKQIIPQMNQATQTFWVEARFTNPPAVLYSGLRGEANIVIARKENVLTIPLEYLYSSDQVLTEKDTLFVKTGLRSLERVEIIEGLDSNTKIIKP
ncbi:efflux RND transporter periplasmic adaptor subunit [Acidiluteibacter ferrifornacis]|uniref:HlyD family efflux transporter periplasmic adaptor subunit n=1 Tax=Acidiluteibacter ferrifornacis TaxID=2692424 RepID=A0A6N9NKD7_9FLAO|nr:HlyD family efflux transporter periplasmic adaptor subunit [Acidiluteibacter ferrifornacis]NBG66319.1 HlyD family efflux transporter periplasmic adaptor subunit [Acidiluteibacter ferrifornacis]